MGTGGRRERIKNSSDQDQLFLLEAVVTHVFKWVSEDNRRFELLTEDSRSRPRCDGSDREHECEKRCRN